MAVSLSQLKAQHFTTCQLCNGNVKFFCKPCNTKLCLDCVTPHLESKAPDHNIIYYHKKKNTLKELADAELVDKIPCREHAMVSICCVEKDKFYVSSHVSRSVQLVDRNGITVNEFETSCLAYRFSAIEDGLLFPGKNGIVLKPNNSEEQLLIATEPATVTCLTFVKPCHIYACVSEGQGVENKVVKYNIKGTVLLEVQFDDGKPLYGYPRSITVNGNGDICVCDSGSTRLDIKSSVTVVDKYGHLRFSYTSNHQESFEPYDLCSNSCFHLIIIEEETNNIHIIDKDGTFLRYLDLEKNPWCICTDNEDILYVCNMFDKYISVIKYFS